LAWRAENVRAGSSYRCPRHFRPMPA
jgi:hypothetical protein